MLLFLSSLSSACACVLSLGTDSGSEIVRLGAGGTIGRGLSTVSLEKRCLTESGGRRTSKGSSWSTPSKLGLVMDVGEVENAEGCSTGAGRERCARQLGSMTPSVSDWNGRDMSSMLRLFSSELMRLNGMSDVLRGEIASPPGTSIPATSDSSEGSATQQYIRTVNTLLNAADVSLPRFEIIGYSAVAHAGASVMTFMPLSRDLIAEGHAYDEAPDGKFGAEPSTQCCRYSFILAVSFMRDAVKTPTSRHEAPLFKESDPGSANPLEVSPYLDGVEGRPRRFHPQDYIISPRALHGKAYFQYAHAR